MMNNLIFITIPFFLCWGSFLNVIAFRLVRGFPFLAPRSQCPTCKTVIRWYDLFPIISWVFLKGRCRSCHTKISWLYPVIELITLVSMVILVACIDPHYWVAYIYFISALIVTIRTDLESFLIIRLFSIGLVPVGLLLSSIQLLPISVFDSALGATCGYTILWIIRKLFWLIRKQEGMGEGDQELLAGIGAFLGPFAVWQTLLLGSITGSLIGIGASIALKKKIVRLPFGPFLALGAFGSMIFGCRFLLFLAQ